MVTPFSQTLKQNDLQLKRAVTKTLQVNVGLLCNLACKHCHLECGPSRSEVMSLSTMKEVVAFAQRNKFEVADITGGAKAHYFRTCWSTFKVTMFTGKIAEQANINLQCFGGSTFELKIVLLKCLGKWRYHIKNT